MATYDLTPANMRSIATKIDALAADYQNLYNSNLFQSLVNGELKEAYKGTDAQALTDRLQSYQMPFNEMTKQIKAYAEFLRATAKSYETHRDNFTMEAASVGKN